MLFSPRVPLRTSLRLAVPCIGGLVAMLVPACSSSSSGGGAGPASGCVAASTLTCASADTGFVCVAGSRPNQIGCDPATVEADGNFDFCCYSGDTSSGCAPIDSAASWCSSGATAYQCLPSASPRTATLGCNEGTGDVATGYVDYCCAPITPVGDGGTTTTPEAGSTPEAGGSTPEAGGSTPESGTTPEGSAGD